MRGSGIQLVALDGMGEVRLGDDLGAMIAAAAEAAAIGLTDADVVVVTQKVVSKAEGRVVDLATVEPGETARQWGEQWGRTRARWSSCCGRAPRCSHGGRWADHQSDAARIRVR